MQTYANFFYTWTAVPTAKVVTSHDNGNCHNTRIHVLPFQASLWVNYRVCSDGRDTMYCESTSPLFFLFLSHISLVSTYHPPIACMCVCMFCVPWKGACTAEERMWYGIQNCVDIRSNYNYMYLYVNACACTCMYICLHAPYTCRFVIDIHICTVYV